MKNITFKKILMMLALIVVVENGAIVASNVDVNTDSYSEEDGTAPCSDLPPLDEDYE